MWLFVYGSLMREDTLKKLGGERFDGAFLRNYRRDFNKQSVERWGTHARPGPTLGLEKARGAGCTGTLFEFSRKDAANVRAQVRRREGASFTLRRRPVRLPNGKEVVAHTPINSVTANSYIGNLSQQQRAQMVLAAIGTAGSCYDYVCSIAKTLKKLGIRDQDVETFAQVVKRLRQSEKGAGVRP
ncbi:MAG: gamma-glutamylcyclotransferase [Verrucomicrobiota bacterium]